MLQQCTQLYQPDVTNMRLLMNMLKKQKPKELLLVIALKMDILLKLCPLNMLCHLSKWKKPNILSEQMLQLCIVLLVILATKSMSTIYISLLLKLEVRNSAVALHKVIPKKDNMSNIQQMELSFQSHNITKKLKSLEPCHTPQSSILCE